jgi:hypothetical protein
LYERRRGGGVALSSMAVAVLVILKSKHSTWLNDIQKLSKVEDFVGKKRVQIEKSAHSVSLSANI